MSAIEQSCLICSYLSSILSWKSDLASCQNCVKSLPGRQGSSLFLLLAGSLRDLAPKVRTRTYKEPPGPAGDCHTMLTPLLWLPICFSLRALSVSPEPTLSWLLLCLSLCVCQSFLVWCPVRAGLVQARLWGTAAAASQLSPVLKAPSWQPPGFGTVP